MFEVDVPAEEAELRWYDGALGTGAVRVVQIIEGFKGTELSRRPGIGASWVHLSKSLSAWAGRRVTIELSNEGEGVGFFGVPQVVRVRPDRRAPDVLVYLLDTLRADRLGAWGSTAGNSPTFDRIASEGVAFRWAFSSSSWTKPAIPTLMTGVLPTVHGVGSFDVEPGRPPRPAFGSRLPDGVAVLAERFRGAGWRTASFVANPWGSALSGLDRGFSTARLPRSWPGRLGEAADQVDARDMHDSFLAWLDEEADRPYFAYIHTMEVHEYLARPYIGSPDPYGAAVRDAGLKLAELLEALRRRGRLDDLLLVVVSDHGESLGEREMVPGMPFVGHGISLYQAEVHIPILFWSTAHLSPAHIEHPVMLADVAPTLLDLFGLDPLLEAHGRSLLPLLRGRKGPVHDAVWMSLVSGQGEQHRLPSYAVVSHDLKKVYEKPNYGTCSWSTLPLCMLSFDLDEDPGEAVPRRADGSKLARRLEAWKQEQNELADRFRSHYGAPDNPALTPQDAERLRALGYVQ